MRSRHVEVVGLDRNSREDILDERTPALPALALGKLDADEQLGCGDRGDCDVVLVGDEGVERPSGALNRDEDGRVENQPFQGRSSMSSVARSSSSSDAHRRSGGFERSISFTAFPLAARAGSIRATARPRRTTTKLSPRRSTASSTSEKRRAASVALRLRIESDYQISLCSPRRVMQRGPACAPRARVSPARRSCGRGLADTG